MKKNYKKIGKALITLPMLAGLALPLIVTSCVAISNSNNDSATENPDFDNSNNNNQNSGGSDSGNSGNSSGSDSNVGNDSSNSDNNNDNSIEKPDQDFGNGNNENNNNGGNSNNSDNNIGNDSSNSDDNISNDNNSGNQVPDNDNSESSGSNDNNSNQGSDDSNSNGSTGSSDIFPGIDDGSGSTIPDDIVDGDPIEGIDFFYLKPNDKSDANKITIPTTKNKNVLEKYGNVPLPWKPDNQITKDDLIYMFDYLVSNLYYQREFGERNIETNLFVNSFIDFLINNYTKYPYISFTNQSWIWNSKEVKGGHNIKNLPNKPEYFDDEVYHVKNNYGPNFNSYGEQLLRPGRYREEFLQFFTYLFSQIRPGMTDIEKALVAYQTLLAWISYGSGGPVSVFSGHTGYCVDYASVYALMLNVLGIHAFAVLTNYNSIQMHGCTWLYIDTGNGEGKQWYVSNPTWGDDNNDVNKLQSKAYLTSVNVFNAEYSPRRYFLADVAKSQFEAFIDDGNYISNRFWSLPWTDWASNNPEIGKVGIGTYSFDGTGIMVPEVNSYGSDTPRSKMVWMDGYWYYINNNSELVRQKTLDTYKQREKVEVPKEIEPLIFNYGALRTTNLMSYNNKFIFEASSSASGVSDPNRSLLIFDSYDGKILWDTKQEIKLEYYSWWKQSKLNLDIFNKKIQIIKNTGDVAYTQDLSNEDIKKLTVTDSKYLTEIELDNAYNLYTMMGNLIMVGEGNNKITQQEKDAYTQKIKSIYEESKKSKQYETAINNIKNEYDVLQSQSSKLSGEMANLRILNSDYFTTQEKFKQYGFNFGGGIDAVHEPTDLINGSDTTSFNIYFSQTKDGEYKLLKENTQLMKITESDFKQIGLNGPEGYYYVEYYPYGKPEYKRTSNITHLTYSDIEIPTSAGEIRFNENRYNTNYSQIDENWENKEFNIVTDFNFSNYSQYDLTYQINYVNYDTRIEKTIYETNSTIQKTINVGSKVDKTNHGLYYAKAILVDKQTQQQITLFSKSLFIMTKEDLFSFDTASWNALSDKIKV